MFPVVFQQSSALVETPALFLSFSGPSAWNALPADIRDEICTATFEKKLKTFYFSLAFDCIWHRFYVTIVMHLRSYSSGVTTKFLTWT